MRCGSAAVPTTVDDGQRKPNKSFSFAIYLHIGIDWTAASHSSTPSPSSWSVVVAVVVEPMCIKHQPHRWGELAAEQQSNGCELATVLAEVNTIYSTKRKYVAWVPLWPCIIRAADEWVCAYLALLLLRWMLAFAFARFYLFNTFNSVSSFRLNFGWIVLGAWSAGCTSNKRKLCACVLMFLMARLHAPQTRQTDRRQE